MKKTALTILSAFLVFLLIPSAVAQSRENVRVVNIGGETIRLVYFAMDNPFDREFWIKVVQLNADGKVISRSGPVMVRANATAGWRMEFQVRVVQDYASLSFEVPAGFDIEPLNQTTKIVDPINPRERLDAPTFRFKQRD